MDTVTQISRSSINTFATACKQGQPQIPSNPSCETPTWSWAHRSAVCPQLCVLFCIINPMHVVLMYQLFHPFPTCIQLRALPIKTINAIYVPISLTKTLLSLFPTLARCLTFWVLINFVIRSSHEAQAGGFFFFLKKLGKTVFYPLYITHVHFIP